MRITEFAKLVGTTPDRLRYLERKGYLSARRTSIKRREVREYSEAEVGKIALIVKYLDEGFKYDAAYRRALDELRQPRMLG